MSTTDNGFTWRSQTAFVAVAAGATPPNRSLKICQISSATYGAIGCRSRISVSITDLRENTFFAEIQLDRNGDRVLIDARPSDSIAIALRAEADIFVAESVIEGAQGQGMTGKVPEKHAQMRY